MKIHVEAGVTKKFKKRHLKELPASAREAIVKMYLQDNIYQKDIAKYYKISPVLVSRLVKEAQENPEKNKKLITQKEEEKELVEAVKSIVKELLELSIPIVKAEMVVDKVKKQKGLDVSVYQVKKIMKDDLNMGYRLTKKVPVQANSERCLVLRQ